MTDKPIYNPWKVENWRTGEVLETDYHVGCRSEEMTKLGWERRSITQAESEVFPSIEVYTKDKVRILCLDDFWGEVVSFWVDNEKDYMLCLFNFLDYANQSIEFELKAEQLKKLWN